jgi:hypothetical protein
MYWKNRPPKGIATTRPRGYAIDRNRRRFLANSASAIAGVTAALAAGKKGIYAWAEDQSRRPRMINIHLPGGWDTNWFHMAFPRSMVRSPGDPADYKNFENFIAGLDPRTFDTTLPTPVAGALDPFARRVIPNGTSMPTSYYHDLYTERTLPQYLVAHPQAGHFFGLGASTAFAGVSGGLSLFNEVCIWKGIYSGGAHAIPNRNIIHGSQSHYAISFSGLIAEAIAKRYGKLKLNYLQLTADPGGFGANWALAKGDQIPINCPDHRSLQDLTKRNPRDFLSDELYNELNGSVVKLGDELGKNRFMLNRSKEIYSEFIRFFNGALDIAKLGANMGTFLDTWAMYANYARERVALMHTNEFVSKISPEVVHPFRNMAYNFHLYVPYPSDADFTPLLADAKFNGDADGDGVDAGSPSPDLNGDGVVDISDFKQDMAMRPRAALYDRTIRSFNEALTTPFQATEASLFANETVWNHGTPDGLRKSIATAAWRFAMADYMITNGYSSVVDMVFGTGDHHANNSNELRLLMVVYSLYAKLLERLDQSGFLDRTLVTVFSEFDRTANISTDTTEIDRGTSHDITESILLAGYGIKRGTVFGDRRYGRQSGPQPGTITHPSGTYANKQIDHMYPFPTFMKIFDVTIPDNQITDAEPVLDVIEPPGD